MSDTPSNLERDKNDLAGLVEDLRDAADEIEAHSVPQFEAAIERIEELESENDDLREKIAKLETEAAQ